MTQSHLPDRAEGSSSTSGRHDTVTVYARPLFRKKRWIFLFQRGTSFYYRKGGHTMSETHKLPEDANLLKQLWRKPSPNGTPVEVSLSSDCTGMRRRRLRSP